MTLREFYHHVYLPYYANNSVGLARTTYYAYTSYLRRFITHAGDLACSALTPDVIAGWIPTITATAPTAGYMARSAVYHFCEHLRARHRLRGINPAQEVKVLCQSAKQRKPAPDDIIQKLLDACPRVKSTPWKCVQARAILGLYAFCALRRSECLDLKLCDIDFDADGKGNAEVTIREGKGGTNETLPLPDDVVKWLREWLAVRPACSHDYLFCTSEVKRFGNDALDGLVRALHRIAGCERVYTPHQLRHAFATRLLRMGVNIKVVAKLMRHKDEATTLKIYAHVDDDDLRLGANLSASLLAFRQPIKTDTPDIPENQKTAPNPQSAKRENSRRFQIERTRRLS